MKPRSEKDSSVKKHADKKFQPLLWLFNFSFSPCSFLEMAKSQLGASSAHPHFKLNLIAMCIRSHDFLFLNQGVMAFKSHIKQKYLKIEVSMYYTIRLLYYF